MVRPERKKTAAQVVPGAPRASPAASPENSSPRKPGPRGEIDQLECGNKLTLDLPGPPARNSSRGSASSGLATCEEWVSLKSPLTQAPLPPLLAREAACVGETVSRLRRVRCLLLRGPGLSVCIFQCPYHHPSNRGPEPMSLRPTYRPQALTVAPRRDLPQASLSFPLVYPTGNWRGTTVPRNKEGPQEGASDPASGVRQVRQRHAAS